ncbi:VOC family protein [Paracoccus luteus]|uniref:VOC family protein n=1 Tax=Paracoccus luteus TaxID=2508543 RepID=UPI00106F3697|nr:VOC family protein [Paracoccus luteus]
MPALVTTPNLPSRSFDATEAFYARLGFVRRWRDEGWMILERDGAAIEFFPHPGLDPKASWFSACIRTDDLDALHREIAALDLNGPQGITRVADDLRMFPIIDPDGSLIRCLGP